MPQKKEKPALRESMTILKAGSEFYNFKYFSSAVKATGGTVKVNFVDGSTAVLTAEQWKSVLEQLGIEVLEVHGDGAKYA
jgi:hypothetical protein